MATYAEKVRKYDIRVGTRVDRGLEPSETDLRKLAYYLHRAETKGADHETKFKDKVHWAKRYAKKKAGKVVRVAGRAIVITFLK